MESPLPSTLALPVEVTTRADQGTVRGTVTRPVARERKRRARGIGPGALAGKSRRAWLGWRALQRLPSGRQARRDLIEIKSGNRNR